MERIYTIQKTIFADNYLFEIVESDGQLGVRCRIYLTDDQLMGEQLHKYADTKYCGLFKTCLWRRFGNEIGLHKFETIIWCSPLDSFSTKIGMEKSKNIVDKLIAKKKSQIKKFFRTLEKHNLPDGYTA